MNLKPILIIVVHNYPYGPGESFFEDELIVIQQHYRKIYFIVTDPAVDLKSEIFYFHPGNSELVIIRNFRLSFITKLLLVYKIFNRESIEEFIRIIRGEFKGSVFSLCKVLIYTSIKGYILKRKLLNFLKEKNLKPEECIFYSYWTNEFTYSLLKLRRKFSGCRVISRAHGWDVYFERSTPQYLPLRKYIVDKCDKYFTVSENAKKYLSEKVSIKDASKIAVSRLGTFKPLNIKDYEPSSKLRILSIAYINKVKRLELIADALMLIDNVEIEWLHIGGRGYFEKFRDETGEKLSLKSNIKYMLPGNLTKKEISGIFMNNTFDFLICTSSSEGIPVSIMEAMSNHTPAIATDVGGVSEIVEDAVNGYLIPPNPAAQLVADTLLKYWKLSTEKKAELRAAAYNTWDEKYNAEKNYTIFAEEILRLK